MRKNKVRSFLGALLRAVFCLALALLIGLIGLTAIAFYQLQSGGNSAGLADAVNLAMEGGFLPLCLGGFEAGWSAELTAAAPVILTALAAALAWQAGLYNLGLAGQYALGAAAAIEGAAWGLPWFACLLLAAAAGAAGGVIPGLLKARFQANEALTTVLMNWICLYGVQALLQGLNRGMGLLPDLGILIPVIAAGAALLCWGLLRYTVPGFEIRVLGDSEMMARYAGMRPGKIMVFVMALSGVLAGIGGALAFISGELRAIPNLNLALTGPGLHGLAVAVLAGGNPLGAVPTGLVISHLARGAAQMNAAVFPQECGEWILALTLLLGSLLLFWGKGKREGGMKK